MSRTKTNYRGAVVAAVAVLILVSPRTALAEFSIGGDLDYVHAWNPQSMSGFGGGIRFGPRLHVPFFVAAPEISLGYHRFTGADALALYRGTAGLRIGVGEIVRPGVFGHIGMGYLNGVDGTQAADRTGTALTWDAGVSIDITIVPIVDVGVHGTWGSLVARSGSSAFGWLMIGPHAVVIF